MLQNNELRRNCSNFGQAVRLLSDLFGGTNRKVLKISQIAAEDSKIFRSFPLESPNRPAILTLPNESSKAEYAVNTFNFFHTKSRLYLRPQEFLSRTQVKSLHLHTLPSPPLLHKPSSLHHFVNLMSLHLSNLPCQSFNAPCTLQVSIAHANPKGLASAHAPQVPMRSRATRVSNKHKPHTLCGCAVVSFVCGRHISMSYIPRLIVQKQYLVLRNAWHCHSSYSDPSS